MKFFFYSFIIFSLLYRLPKFFFYKRKELGMSTCRYYFEFGFQHHHQHSKIAYTYVVSTHKKRVTFKPLPSANSRLTRYFLERTAVIDGRQASYVESIRSYFKEIKVNKCFFMFHHTSS